MSKKLVRSQKTVVEESKKRVRKYNTLHTFYIQNVEKCITVIKYTCTLEF